MPRLDATLGILPRLRYGLCLALAVALPSFALAQERRGENIPGQFFSIEEPIDSDLVSRIKSAAKQVIFKHGKDSTPVLVFEIRPGKSRPGSSELGTSFELADFLSTELGGATVVAYVPEPLTGYAVLPVLACDEVVMGAAASIGPITPESKTANPAFLEPIRILARRKGRSPDLYLGLYDRTLDLRRVRTAGNQLQYVAADRLEEFKRTNQVTEERPAWDGAAKGVLPSRRAREEGFAKLLVENRGEIANAYRLAPGADSDDPTLFQDPKPIWIQLDGVIDARMRNYVGTRIEKARKEGANLIFLQIRSDGGLDTEASNIAQILSDASDVKTVAFVDDRATGLAAMVAMACDDLVIRKGGKIGGITEIRTGRDSATPLSESQIDGIASRIESLAGKENHPPALARAMADAKAVVVEATDKQSGARVLLLRSQVDADPARYVDSKVVKDPGQVWTLTADEAAGFGLARVANDEEDLKGLYELRGKTIRVEGPTWVDGLVTTLNQPFVSGLLLFIGIFMLILEIKMPGVGLPAILSVVAFLLFFWSRFLNGTADQLEIILFVVGLVCILLEIFVFPGFGVFGFSGILMVLVSIVMASHTFVWPTQEYEYRQMATTLMQIIAVMFSVGAGIAMVARYLPSIPIVNRLVLRPEPAGGYDYDEVTGKPIGNDLVGFDYLLGETGRTTTTLRPTGRAKFGDQLLDVLADGVFIEPNTTVEVIDVRGATIVVRPLR
ncbi:MAG: NfeD family protein [Isosphaeraceae bacterium]|nr:NfeD family protein [Isosphaeraceae bacterium]